MEPITTPKTTVLLPAQVDDMPWEPLGAAEGAQHKVVWRDDTSMAGVLRLDAGHRLGAHTHHANQHHMWLLEGTARILGTDLGGGAYVHIPAGVEHDIDATRSQGCTLFYLYTRPSDA